MNWSALTARCGAPSKSWDASSVHPWPALIAADIAVLFGFDADILALAIGIVWLIALPIRQPSAPQRFWLALREGLRWMRSNPALLQLAAMLGAVNAVSVGGMAVLVLYARRCCTCPATGYGALLACAAAGGALGGPFSPALAGRLGMRMSLILSLVSFVGLHLLLGLFSSTVLAGLATFCEAAEGMLWNVITVSYRQRLIPDDLLGRVNAVYRFFSWGAMPLGTLAAGVSVAILEPALGRTRALYSPYLVGALMSVGLLACGLLRLRFDQKTSALGRFAQHRCSASAWTLAAGPVWRALGGEADISGSRKGPLLGV